MATAELVEFIASWGGARDNGRGDWWCKFNVPQTETPQVMVAMAYFAGKEVWAFLRLQDGSMHEIAHGPFNGVVQSPQHWSYNVSVRAAMQNVTMDSALTMQLKDTSFQVRMCTVDALHIARVNDVPETPQVSSFGERQENDREDLTEDEYAL